MKKIFIKAYDKMCLLYGEYPDVRVLSRFYNEKAMLAGHEPFVTYLDAIGRMRERAEERDERVRVAGPIANLFVSYLLGATDLNPLRTHEYCPQCRELRFLARQSTPLGQWHSKCPCGGNMSVDGWSFPYEMALPYAQRGVVNVSVSYGFFDEAKSMLQSTLQEKYVVVTLCDGEAPTLTRFITQEMNEAVKTLCLQEERVPFARMPHITLVPYVFFDSCRALERATGVRMRDAVDDESAEVLQDLTSGDVRGLPHVDMPHDFWNKTIKTLGPPSFYDLLKVMGFAHSTQLWLGNADGLFAGHRVTLADIPASPEDVFDMIAEKLRACGITDMGLAYNVAQNVRRGIYESAGGMDEQTLIALLGIGIPQDLIFLLEKTAYLFPKAQAASYLKEAAAMSWYRQRYPEEFGKAFWLSQT